MPLILIYWNLDTISDCFLYFTQQMGREQYHPSSVEPVAKNRLFSQYHYQNQPTYVFFVTVAFRIGTDCNSIRRIIHIGVPKTYFKLF